MDEREATAPVPTPCGLLVIDKPLGRSSMDVCRVVRRRLINGGAPKRVKVGHGGTLDPLATGVLVVMVGKATGLCERVMAGRKQYVADVDLSAFTATDDAEGERQEVHVAHAPDESRLRAALDGLTGRILQAPPAFSAIKIGGRRAYDLARAGQSVAPAARHVDVHEIAIERYAWPHVRLRIDSGKGVYIRSIARDLGRALGTGGHLIGLRRTRVGRWTIEQAQTLDGVPNVLTQAGLLDLPADA
jgi:tRNA pseudouridine55 synthase